MKPWLGAEGQLRIEQEVNDDTMTIRVEMPGIDSAERRSETKDESEVRIRSEFHYGSFERRLRVPKGVGLDDVKATCKDGILQVVLPYKVATEEQSRKIAIERG